MKRERSDIVFSKAQGYMPGGVNSPVRAYKSVKGDPIIIKSGKGSIIYDVDGNSYLDFVGSWGPLILGHANPDVLSAISDSAVNGLSFGATTELEVKLAEIIIDAVKSVEMVRFVNSGTEATMTAIRLARAFTKRNLIIKFEGCYHGHGDSFLTKAGSGVADLDEASSGGIPESIISNTITVPYNGIVDIENVFQSMGDNIAAVIIEPIAGNMGMIMPEEGFLDRIRSLTHSHGSLLIFDEVISGFRVAYGGAQKIFNIDPDITCFGKIIGGGLPIGAFGGRADIMQKMAPLGEVYQAGTLSGNPVVMSAGIATLKVLRDGKVYNQLEELGSYFQKTLLEYCNGESIQFPRCGSMFGLFFSSSPVHNWNDVVNSEFSRYRDFHHLMLNEGFYLPPSPYETIFISSSHSKKELDGFIKAAASIIKRI
tara:strand:- start:978 stop:2255 length:1278 start_codon:yes stop_codon:yes gene_type:complete